MIRRLIDWLLDRRHAPSPAQQLAALSSHARIVAAATDKERARLRAQQMRDAMPGHEWRHGLA